MSTKSHPHQRPPTKRPSLPVFCQEHRRSDSDSVTPAAAVGTDRQVMNLRLPPVNNKHAWLLAISADTRREHRPDLHCYRFLSEDV